MHESTLAEGVLAGHLARVVSSGALGRAATPRAAGIERRRRWSRSARPERRRPPSRRAINARHDDERSLEARLSRGGEIGRVLLDRRPRRSEGSARLDAFRRRRAEAESAPLMRRDGGRIGRARATRSWRRRGGRPSACGSAMEDKGKTVPDPTAIRPGSRRARPPPPRRRRRQRDCRRRVGGGTADRPVARESGGYRPSTPSAPPAAAARWPRA